MKKLKLFSLALMALFATSVWAETLFTFTVTSSTTAIDSYTATGGTAACSGSAMSTGGTNEMTVGTQTFYKFNSSTQWTFTLSSGNFAVGDVISFTCAANTSSDKSGKGVKINNSIAVTGDFPKNETNTISYTVAADDGIAGQNSFYIKRNDSDIKFGTVTVTGTRATYKVTIDPNGGAYASTPTGWTYDEEKHIYTKSGLSGSFNVPDGLAKENNALVGWKDNHTTPITLPITLSKDTTLVAQWEAEECPSGLTIDGEDEYTEGETIELTAALEAGNGEITYTWYKGTDLATAKTAGSIGTGASFSKASCNTSDAGNYWCEATKTDCSAASNASAFTITVAEMSLVSVSDDITWDFSKIARNTSSPLHADDAIKLTDSSTPSKNEEILYAKYAGGNLWTIASGFDGTKIAFTGEYPTRYNKQCQNGTLRFNTTVPGSIVVKFSDTGTKASTSAVKRYLVVNGETTTYWTSRENNGTEAPYAAQLNVTSGAISVPAGDVTITGTSAIIVTEVAFTKSEETAIDNTSDELNALKRIENGMLIIEKNGIRYNAQGQVIR